MWGTKSMLSGLNDGNAGHESMQIEKSGLKKLKRFKGYVNADKTKIIMSENRIGKANAIGQRLGRTTLNIGKHQEEAAQK